MKKNQFVINSLLALSLVGTLSFADAEVNDDDIKKINITSSISISPNASEKTEQSLVTVDIEKIVQNVKSKFTGKIINIKLENKNGNLIYLVEVFNNNQITDILLDAGNGKVLASRIDNQDNRKNRDKRDKRYDNEDDENHEHDEEHEDNETWYKF